MEAQWDPASSSVEEFNEFQALMAECTGSASVDLVPEMHIRDLHLDSLGFFLLSALLEERYDANILVSDDVSRFQGMTIVELFRLCTSSGG